MRITLDGGHGGSDSGAVGGVVEKVENLEYTLELGRCLSKLGFTVDYTRTTDVYVSLSDRAIQANNAGADYFVSWHFNSGGGRGIEVYSLATTGAGAKLANAVVAEMVAATGAINRGAKTANFAVLRLTYMPAILIEGGFVDTTDADLIKTEEYKRNCIIGATKGICAVLGVSWSNPYVTIQEANTVENLVVYFGDGDVPAAILLSYKLNCPMILKAFATPYLAAAKKIHLVGGPEDIPGAIYYSGTDRMETAKKVLA